MSNYISPLSYPKLKRVKIVLTKPVAVGDKIINVSMVDDFIYPHMKMNAMFGGDKITGTYTTSYLPNEVIESQQIILDTPITQAYPITYNDAYYMSAFSVDADNELLSESDAVNRLVAEENKYPLSTLIDQPQNYSDGGKPGLIAGEDLNKLNRLYKFVEFDDIDFTGNVLQTIAVIKCDSDYRLHTDIIINEKSSVYLGLTFDCDGVSFDDANTNQYLVVNHYEQKIANTPRISFYRERLVIGGVMTHFIRVKFGFVSPVKNCQISIGVTKFDNLINQKKLADVSGTIESKKMILNGNEVNDIVEGIIGYTSTGKYTLLMDGESPIKPIEITTGLDLNDYKTPGFFVCSQAVSGSIKNRPKSVPTINIYDPVSFRLEVSSDLDGNTKQEYSYYQLPQLEKVPRIFVRHCIGITWTEWSEIGLKVHTHKLMDMISTDESMHFTKVLKDLYDETATITANGPWKKRYSKIEDASPFIHDIGDVVSIQGPESGLYMCEIVGGIKTWVPKTTESLKVFDVAVRQTVKGLISPELYDEWQEVGFGRLLTDGTKDLIIHKDNTFANYTIYREAFDLVKRTGIVNLGEHSLSIGWGNTFAGDNSIGLGYNVDSSMGKSVSIGSNIYGDGCVKIGHDLVTENEQIVFGKYNVHNPDVNVIIGIGIDESSRRNILTIDEYYVKGPRFARFAPARGKEYAHAMLEDGSGLNIDILGKQFDIDRLYENKANRGASYKVAFYGIDGSVNYDFFVIDDNKKEIIVPNGILVVKFNGICETPEKLLLDPSVENMVITVPSSLTKTGKDEKIIMEVDPGTDESIPIDLSDPKYSSLIDWTKIQVVIKGKPCIKILTYNINNGEYWLEYTDGTNILYFSNKL